MSRVLFGPFAVDLGSGELRKHGVPIKVQEQPTKILAALLRRPGEVVSREELIKELWDNDTHVDYDRGLNAAINRLRQALSDSAESPRYIETVAKRGYRFIAELSMPADERVPTGPEDPHPPAAATAAPPKRSTLALVAGLVVCAAITAWLLFNPVQRARAAPSQHEPLTTYDGNEAAPSFSPDGSQIAFSWDGPNQDNHEIYVKTVGSDPPLRLTATPGPEGSPAWSPDGRHIAFLRANGIFLIPPTGGSERRILELSVDPAVVVSRCWLSWSPDSKTLAYAMQASQHEPSGIFILDIESGKARRLTKVDYDSEQRAPAFSPDGKSIAYAACHGGISDCALYLLELKDGGVSSPRERRLVSTTGRPVSIAWTRDGNRLVTGEYLINTGSFQLSFYRLPSPEKPEEFIAAGNSLFPAVSSIGNRLAYSRRHADFDIYLLSDNQVVRSPISSTLLDLNPQFSPDGTKIVFASTRSGTMEIWVANRDGTSAVRLTTSRGSGSPRWSPDGKWIVFDRMVENGDWNVMVMDSSGGKLRAIASGPANEKLPGFSRDGKSIYFSATRDGRDEIYRVPFEGGEPERITYAGGWVALESGESIYYSKANTDCGIPLYRKPIRGGPEEKVLDAICGRAFFPNESGVYFSSGATQSGIAVQFFDPRTNRTREVARMPGQYSRPEVHLSASPDGKAFVISASRSAGADLYLVENFR